MNKQCHLFYLHERCVEMCEQVNLEIEMNTGCFTVVGEDVFFTFETVQEIKAFIDGYHSAKGLES